MKRDSSKDRFSKKAVYEKDGHGKNNHGKDSHRKEGLDHHHSIYGLHAINSFLMHHSERAIELWAVPAREDKRIEELLSLARSKSIPVKKVERDLLDQMTEHHQGLLLLCHPLPPLYEEALDELLEQLQDKNQWLLDCPNA